MRNNRMENNIILHPKTTNTPKTTKRHRPQHTIQRKLHKIDESMIGPICNSHYIMKRKKLQVKMIKEINYRWLNPREFYINTFINHEPLNHCPECGGEIKYSSEDEDEAYCTHCGLIVSASSRYVAGMRIDLPYGIRL